MPLIHKIKDTQLQARKNRNTLHAAALTTLIGEAEAIGKNAGNREVTDAELLALMKKFIKNAEETKRIAVQYGNRIALEQLEGELQLYNSFLPQQLTEPELLAQITEIVHGDKTQKMGDIMKVLKAQSGGLYDGALASKLIKSALS